MTKMKALFDMLLIAAVVYGLCEAWHVVHAAQVVVNTFGGTIR